MEKRKKIKSLQTAHQGEGFESSSFMQCSNGKVEGRYVERRCPEKGFKWVFRDNREWKLQKEEKETTLHKRRDRRELGRNRRTKLSIIN